jgi:hypothetical protein
MPLERGVFNRALTTEPGALGTPKFFATMMAERTLARLNVGFDELTKLHDLSRQQLDDTVDVFKPDL